MSVEWDVIRAEKLIILLSNEERVVRVLEGFG